MNAQDFTYWLQGFAELNERAPDEAQWKSIKEHLNLVFNKVTPGLEFTPSYPPLPFKPSPTPWDSFKIEPMAPQCDDAKRQTFKPGNIATCKVLDVIG